MARMQEGMGMEVSASNILHISTAKAIKYRQVEMTPIMMDPVRREQQMQDVRNAIFQIFVGALFVLNLSTGVMHNYTIYINT